MYYVYRMYIEFKMYIFNSEFHISPVYVFMYNI